MKSKFLAAAALAGAFARVLSAHAGVLVPIPPIADSVQTFVAGINDNNEITGYYTTDDEISHGFVGTLDGNYTSFDYPGTGVYFTGGRAINNDGYVTGQALSDQCEIYCELIRTPDGKIKTVTKDGIPLQGFVQGIISKTRFVGEYAQGTSYFGYFGKGSKYQAPLTLPFNTDRTRPRGYAVTRVIVEYFRDLDNGGDYPGFVLNNGNATAVRYPDQNAYSTYFEGINTKGMVSEMWTYQQPTFEKAFLFDSESGQFAAIDVPGATDAFATGINNAGVVAVTGDDIAYIYCPKKKTCPIHSPHEIEIQERWISAAGYSRTLPCKNGCMGPHHESAQHDPAAVRAIARNPDLQRELQLPFRP